MEILNVIKSVKQFFNHYIQPIHKITKIEPCDQGWHISVEVIEENEYMIENAKDQLLGEYDVNLDCDLNVTDFKRVGLRSRCSIPE